MNRLSNSQVWLKFLCLAILILPSSLAVMAQGKDPGADQFVGHYKGTVKRASGQTDVTIDIKSADGKFSGRAVTAEGEYPISSGEIAGGKLTLKLGAPAEGALLTLQKGEDKLVGEWVRGADKGTVELKKAAAEVFTAEMLNGEWEAVADAQGQPFPFLLTLKVDGEKVSGTSSSQLGTSNISSGSWKDGKLAIVLEGSAGQIAMGATMIEGKLSGEFDFAGQLSGKWVAIKKK
jgi:hypothetical protein